MIEQRVIETIAELTDADLNQIGPNTKLVDIVDDDSDSLSFIRLLIAIEKNFGVTISGHQLEPEYFETPSKIAKLIRTILCRNAGGSDG